MKGEEGKVKGEVGQGRTRYKHQGEYGVEDAQKRGLTLLR
jgi:hypothetical protein